jgi:DNA modification methylase
VDVSVLVLRGDARALPLPDASVDAIVCDPPYGLEFMGREWDSFRPGGKRPTIGTADGTPYRRNTGTPAWAGSGNPVCLNCGGTKYDRTRPNGCACDRPTFPNESGAHMRAFQAWCEHWAGEAYRVLKPGGHLLAFGGTRTWHRLTCAIEDAGFEIRDSMAWLYGSGFPKSHDVSKAIDVAAGAEREVVGTGPDHAKRTAAAGAGVTICREGGSAPLGQIITAPATNDARRWQGWGTALKPGFEPIVVARKPLAGTVVANVLAHGTGALNITACRVGAEARVNNAGGASSLQRVSRVEQGYRSTVTTSQNEAVTVEGRWPTNVVLSHAPLLDEHAEVVGDACADGCVPGCPIAELDGQSGLLTSGANPTRRGSDKFRDAYGDFAGQTNCVPARGVDTGGASRFFPTFRYEAKAPDHERPRVNGVAHPTVKPLGLIRLLCRLVTPPSGLVLDMFAGSGTTGEAALMEGLGVVLVEREADHLPLIRYRIDRARRRLQPGMARLGRTALPKPVDGQEALDLFA